MNILIVEDDENSRVFLERALKKEGHFVSAAQNGVQALEMAAKQVPDMIISDILMPEMDGFELCRRVKADEQLRGIPFVFYTATFSAKKDEQLGMALGASRFIRKPLEIDNFLTIIEEVMKQHKEEALPAPEKPAETGKELNNMYSERIAEKLEKKVMELERERKVLKQTLHEKEVLLREVHHRVKNSLLTLYSLIGLQQAGLKGDEDVNQLLDVTKQRVHTMGKVHKMLYQSGNLLELDFSEYIKSIAQDIRVIFRTADEAVNVTLNLEPVTLTIDEAIPCGLILNELLMNAYQHAFTGRRSGHIAVSFSKKDDIHELRISDDGIGMPEELVSGEIKTLGLHLVDLLTRQLKGEMSYKRENGSAFTIRFKKAIIAGEQI